MKYLVAADSADIGAKIAKRFGHAGCHMIVDSDDMDFDHFSGSCHELPEYEIDCFEKDALQGVITGNIGPHAFDQISAKGWDIFIVRNKTVSEAVNVVMKGEIKPAKSSTAKRSIHSGQPRHRRNQTGHQGKRGKVAG
ncbi:MAG: NifB/NifX family molybdenum-iron cluster-binding protein [Candidatus Electryonea clarkiae]|nr:NifB/NifX family molybdenum-iron cluster-binding protein [Candidatus Electryonea clarkiae]MDP8285257.1 NifB/NifX family molybdenum-iron cluster-binding protein [Candidatus Electryonea clarkiae]